MEAGLGSEWGRNEGYGCRYFAGWSGLEPPFPFHKQCLAYFRSSNAMAESFNLYMHIPAKFRLAKSSPSVNFRCRTRHYTFRCVAVL